MEYILTPYQENRENWAFWENGFTHEELNWLQQKAKESNQVGYVGYSGPNHELLNDIRRSKIDWMKNTSETQWVYTKLAHIVSSLNSMYFGLDITCFGEAFQLTNYLQEENGMYGWHQDMAGVGKVSRKLSLVLQLSDPSEYEGGNLQIMIDKNPVTLKKQRGLIYAFPSYQLHQVTPVTNGSRQTLVAWASGPAFK